MKLKLPLLLLAALVSDAGNSNLLAQATTFTYQGQLTDNGVPASGIFDLRFTIYDSSGGPTAVAGPVTNSPVAVSNGLFTVTLDFGAGVFDGGARWLEIGVVTNAGGVFDTLSPRQQITSAPYAVKAVNAMALNMGVVSNPVFIGTTTNTPLEFYANNEVALRLDNPTVGTSPSLIGGSSANSIATNAQGSVIGGGGSSALPNRIDTLAHFSVISGGASNSILGSSQNSTISGGGWNWIDGMAANGTISGGQQNYVGEGADIGVVAGGFHNQIWSDSDYGAIGGGWWNIITNGADYGTISGGYYNTVSGGGATIGGGFGNTAQGSESTIGGGQANTTSNSWAIVGGGQGNVASGDHATIGGGRNNQTQSTYATVAGGNDNNAEGFQSTIGGGDGNDATASGATVSGGINNLASGFNTIVGGGEANEATMTHSVVSGGQKNQAIGNWSAVMGGQDNTASASHATIGGGLENSASAIYATVAGGQTNVAANAWTTIGGGEQNVATGGHATIAGGEANVALIDWASVGGGFNNTAMGQGATVPGGIQNEAAGSASLAAGARAKAVHDYSFVWADSPATDFSSTTNNQFLIHAANGIGLGGNDTSFGIVQVQQPSDDIDHGLAVANVARTRTLRLWADGSDKSHIDSGPTGSADLIVNSGGGRVGIGTSSPTEALDVMGNIVATGTINGSSDRDLKEDFKTVSPLDVLTKVVALPITEWKFKADSVHHVGPMAQDFHSAFGVGSDDKHIATVDADGVALAAIQGLNQKVESGKQIAEDRRQRTEDRIQKLEAELSRRDAENAELKARLEKLEQLLNEKFNGGAK